MAEPDAWSRTTWDERTRWKLTRARLVRGHTQSDLIAELRRRGIDGISQPTVSGWENGRIRRPSDDVLRAIHEYIEDSLPSSTSQVGPITDTDAGAAEPMPEFDDLVRTLTDQPLLGELQSDFVRAAIARLSRSPLSRDEIVFFRDLARTLGLKWGES